MPTRRQKICKRSPFRFILFFLTSEKSKQIEKIKSESVDSAIQEQKPSRHSHENDEESIEEGLNSEEMNPEEFFADNEAEEEENLEYLDQEDDETLEIGKGNDEDESPKPL